MNGGPVEGTRGFLPHSSDFMKKDTIRVAQDYGVTGTMDALGEILEGHGPDHLLFVLGHAGWSAGQLDQELLQNAWLTAEATPELIFDTPPAQQWHRAMAQIGIDPVMLSSTAGRA